MLRVKQILLRVPDELHRRLMERARRDGRSVNALAGELLDPDADADADAGERQARLRARIATSGLSAAVVDADVEVDRDAVIARTREWGPMVDDLLAAERDPR